jgi:hypothetical protein
MFCPSTRLGFTLIGLVLLSACSGSSGALEQLQKQIQEEVVKQGAGSVKRVMCESPKSGDEKSLLCTGLLESGSGFEIPVQKQDDQSYKWEILSIKGLLNMAQVQRSIQDGLKAEVGEATLDCGAGASLYKVVNTGDTFDCQFKVTTPPNAAAKQKTDSTQPLSNEKTPAPDQTDSDQSKKPPLEQNGKVTVSIMPSGDVSWQRIVAEKPNDKAVNAATSTSEKSATSASDTAKSKPSDRPAADAKSPSAENSPATTAPASEGTAPAQTAEDALNQGALDNLED